MTKTKRTPKPIVIERIWVDARYHGRRKLHFCLPGDRARYSILISANPRDTDPKDLKTFCQPMAGLRFGDEGWFPAGVIDTPKGRRIALAAWSKAERQDLITPEVFARADAQRVVDAEIYRRSGDLHAIVVALAALDILPVITDGGERRRADAIQRSAKAIVKDIEAQGGITYETVLKSLQKLMHTR